MGSRISLLLLLGITALGITALRIATLVGEAGEELVDEALEHDGGLRLIDVAAVLEKGVGAAGVQADVLASEQALRLDARKAVIGNLFELRIDPHADYRLVDLGVVADAFHLAYAHA